eukprot:CAMPEP_0194444034 /NCGR_PEP_ID=MMETSP0176-20130528/127038_1 /TAXON_ID=216777 /ORGANISM="Proboscia alata, Strain PI-D3" /LENGTH=409 /DNA_ID=CAMNT_0039270353 /DNA_START=17 /DNA_END=1247 /DNA_ORIENTATION=+
MTEQQYYDDPKRAESLISILTQSPYNVTDTNLCRAIAALGEATALSAKIIANACAQNYAGSQNKSGDDQLKLDIDCDNACFHAFRKSGVYATGASEETPVETPLNATTDTDVNVNGLYSIGFDPLDGSSIINANFSVGGIFGVWPGTNVLGRTGREQIVSAVSVYGPRTTLCIGLTNEARNSNTTTTETDKPRGGIVLEVTLVNNRTEWKLSRGDIRIQAAGKIFAPGNPVHGLTNEARNSNTTTTETENPGIVLEVTLVNNRTEWKLSRNDIRIQAAGKIFAPGNLRASNDNPAYGALIQHWISNRYTLRYTGGMVPDIYHILCKGKGVFTNVSSDVAPAKLRLLYEVAPIGLIIELAGGKTVHESREGVSVLDIAIEDLDQRLGLCLGSTDEVDTYVNFMFHKEHTA